MLFSLNLIFNCCEIYQSAEFYNNKNKCKSVDCNLDDYDNYLIYCYFSHIISFFINVYGLVFSLNIKNKKKLDETCKFILTPIF